MPGGLSAAQKKNLVLPLTNNEKSNFYSNPFAKVYVGANLTTAATIGAITAAVSKKGLNAVTKGPTAGIDSKFKGDSTTYIPGDIEFSSNDDFYKVISVSVTRQRGAVDTAEFTIAIHKESASIVLSKVKKGMRCIIAFGYGDKPIAPDKELTDIAFIGTIDSPSVKFSKAGTIEATFVCTSSSVLFKKKGHPVLPRMKILDYIKIMTLKYKLFFDVVVSPAAKSNLSGKTFQNLGVTNASELDIIEAIGKKYGVYYTLGVGRNESGRVAVVLQIYSSDVKDAEKMGVERKDLIQRENTELLGLLASFTGVGSGLGNLLGGIGGISVTTKGNYLINWNAGVQNSVEVSISKTDPGGDTLISMDANGKVEKKTIEVDEGSGTKIYTLNEAAVRAEIGDASPERIAAFLSLVASADDSTIIDKFFKAADKVNTPGASPAGAPPGKGKSGWKLDAQLYRGDPRPHPGMRLVIGAEKAKQENPKTRVGDLEDPTMSNPILKKAIRLFFGSTTKSLHPYRDEGLFILTTSILAFANISFASNLE
jgi:hypothetical protein